MGWFPEFPDCVMAMDHDAELEMAATENNGLNTWVISTLRHSDTSSGHYLVENYVIESEVPEIAFKDATVTGLSSMQLNLSCFLAVCSIDILGKIHLAKCRHTHLSQTPLAPLWTFYLRVGVWNRLHESRLKRAYFSLWITQGTQNSSKVGTSRL